MELGKDTLGNIYRGKGLYEKIGKKERNNSLGRSSEDQNNIGRRNPDHSPSRSSIGAGSTEFDDSSPLENLLGEDAPEVSGKKLERVAPPARDHGSIPSSIAVSCSPARTDIDIDWDALLEEPDIEYQATTSEDGNLLNAVLQIAQNGHWGFPLVGFETEKSGNYGLETYNTATFYRLPGNNGDLLVKETVEDQEEYSVEDQEWYFTDISETLRDNSTVEISYNPDRDVQPESEEVHGEIFLATRLLAQNGVEADVDEENLYLEVVDNHEIPSYGDEPEDIVARTSNEGNAAEIIWAMSTLDQSLEPQDQYLNNSYQEQGQALDP